MILLFGHAILPEETEEGNSTMLYTLSQGLKEFEDVVVLSYLGRETYTKRINGVDYHFIKNSGNPLIKLLRAVFKAYQLKRKYKPRVMYTVGFGTITYIMSLFLRVPYIIHTVGKDITRYVDKKELVKSGEIKENMKEKFISWLNLKSLKKAKAIIGGRGHIKKAEKVIGKEVNVVRTPIDTEKFQKRNVEEKNVVLWVGRIVPFKNLESIIEVAGLIKDAEFWIVGPPYNKEYLNKIKGLVKEKKLTNVKFLGPVNRYELPGYYSQAKLFIHTSHTEGLPQTVLEALACELPVVAFNYSGAEEVVESGKNGYVVERDNSKLAEKLKKVLEDDELKEKLGKRARLLASEYSVRNSSKRIYNIINKKS